MLWVDIIFSFLVALVLSFVLVGLLNRRHPAQANRVWPGAFFLFLVLFLSAWAGGVWVYDGPADTIDWGTYWIPFLAVAILVTLLAAAVLPVRPRKQAGDASEPDTKADPARMAGGFFYLFIFVLMVAIIAYYVATI